MILKVYRIIFFIHEMIFGMCWDEESEIFLQTEPSCKKWHKNTLKSMQMAIFQTLLEN